MTWTRDDARLPWPFHVPVQAGSRGVVFRRDGSTYRTAFFEAFPPPNGFIRGEGETIADAEDAAWSQFIRESGCEHEFERRNYTNGAGICRHCGGFRARVFEELPPDPSRKPSWMERMFSEWPKGVGRED